MDNHSHVMSLITNRQSKQKGFTLIELVITMSMVTVLAMVVGLFSATPIRSYISIVKRVQLVDSAELALRRMGRDIHHAIPNSIRTKVSGTKQAIEMVNIVEGVRYRAQGPAANALNFTTQDTDFDIWGNFNYADITKTGYRLVIYNTGAVYGNNFDSPIPGANVYSTANAAIGSVIPPPGSHVITPVGRIITLTNPIGAGHINIGGGGWQFAFTSPQQKLFITDGPVSYVCDSSTGIITRYSGYSMTDVQPISFADSTPSAALSNHVSACTFSYLQGSSARNAMVVMRISLTDGGETITLMHQIEINNTP
jgi:MSHA biogenesis protein MshO